VVLGSVKKCLPDTPQKVLQYTLAPLRASKTILR
jgi:hypothetical protein